MWQLEDVLKAVGGTLLSSEQEEFASVSTDSRSIKKGELFVPLIGSRFDGHAFVREAYAKCGAGCLCQKDRESACAGCGGTIILVDDTTKA